MHGFEPVVINLCLIWFVKNYYTDGIEIWSSVSESKCLKKLICKMDIDAETESVMLNI